MLVLASGWHYTRDIKLSHWGKKINAVGSHLDIVDDLLFEGQWRPEGERIE